MDIALFTDTSLSVVDGVGRVVKVYAGQINFKGHRSFLAIPKVIC